MIYFTLHWTCDYLSMPRLKLIHISKRRLYMRVGDYGEMWLIVSKYGYKIKTVYGYIQTETFVTHMKRLNTVKPLILEIWRYVSIQPYTDKIKLLQSKTNNFADLSMTYMFLWNAMIFRLLFVNPSIKRMFPSLCYPSSYLHWVLDNEYLSSTFQNQPKIIPINMELSPVVQLKLGDL